MLNRREFLKLSAAAGASVLVPWDVSLRGGPGVRVPRAFAQIPGGTLAPGDVDKFVLPLVKPPAMPGDFKKNKDQYRIGVRQFTQRILSPPHPKTTVWSYGDIRKKKHMFDGGTFNYPAFTIEAKWNKTTQVQWRNELVDANGNFLPHLLPVDQTLHWANPPGGLAGRDKRPTFTATPGPYMGPVPIVTHVHGAHTTEDSDGYAEAWYLPAANDIPAGYATTGTFFDYFNAKYGHNWSPGTASFKYPNDQPATTLWYHDHTLGMTRLNVYAGPAGYWLIRGGPNDDPDNLHYVAPGVGDNPLGEYTEIPIVIQDRSFNENGSLFYPDSRTFFDGEGPPYIPDSSVSPIWNPEFFGNMMVVNGFTWPYLEVEKKRYRFRFLNGCNSRFLVLKMTMTPRSDNTDFNTPDHDFWQIGGDQGFLPDAVPLDQLLMGPAERADVIVDFSGFDIGDKIYLVNDGPDAPFGGIPTPPLSWPDDISDHASTGLVMMFEVVNRDDLPMGDLPTSLPAAPALGAKTNTRNVSLNEETAENDVPPRDIPVAALLGASDTEGGLLWSDPITENPAAAGFDPANPPIEEWKIYNFTEDAHPIHVHLVKFEVVGRGADGTQAPEVWEEGFKDTVIAYPEEITRIKAKYDLPGFYVWHCHIVEHEDNEMMRPYHVGPIPPDAPAQ
jgi:spore coat protein A